MKAIDRSGWFICPRVVLVVLAALAVLFCTATGLGGDGRPTAAPEKGTRRGKAPKIIAEREAAALTFVRKNHPQLLQLLEYLKDHRPADYRRAIYELYRTSERLAQFQDRDEVQRYELELKLWQTQSRIQLIVAQLKMEDTPELRQELKAQLARQMELRATLLNRERDRLAERLRKLDEQIMRLTQGRDAEVERQIRLLCDQRSRPARRSGKAGKGEAATKKQRKENQARETTATP